MTTAPDTVLPFTDLDAASLLFPYDYRCFPPGLGRWLSRDPIGERGGMNLYGYSINDPLGHYDYLGLTGAKRACSFRIIAGHGWVPVPGQKTDESNSETERLADSMARSSQCGDRVGVVSCFSGDINKDLDTKAIPGGNNRYYDPKFSITDPNQPGLLPVSKALDDLEAKIKAAQDQAEKDCGDKDSCCFKIEIRVHCIGDQRYPGLNFQKMAQQSDRGKKLCNYYNALECRRLRWAKDKL